MIRLLDKCPIEPSIYARWLNGPENRYTEARFTMWSDTLAEAWFERECKRRKVFGVYSDGEFVGTVTVGPVNQRHGSAEVGIFIHTPGKGIGTEALKQAVVRCGLERYEAHVLAENVASRRVFEKAGFVQEGLLRGARVFEGGRVDVAVYGLLREET